MSVSTEIRRTWNIQTHLPVSYDVVYTHGLFEPSSTELLASPESQQNARTQLVVLDQSISEIYGQKITDYFDGHGVICQTMVMSGDESSKTIDNALAIVSALNKLGASRRADPPLAVGGGVIADVVGLAASLFRRGIPYFRVPTTLLGAVDVSVAAKTGVNYEGFRNRLGSYSPPPRTFVDPAFLASLPERHIRNGMGEILKLAAIKDRELFELLERSGRRLVETKFQEAGDADTVITRSIQGMAEELADNLWEKTLERCVDFGHSFSPLVEMTVLPGLLHGEAVVLDCILSSFLSLHRELVPEADVVRLLRTTQDSGLPTWHPGFADVDLLNRALEDTVRHRNGNQNLPLMSGLGTYVFANDISPDEIARAAEAMASWSETNPPLTSAAGETR
jgi:2-epi-5-epi-valiolone synthase